jgi:hypothetical protein
VRRLFAGDGDFECYGDFSTKREIDGGAALLIVLKITDRSGRE